MKARATFRLAAVVALAVTVLSLVGMGLQYRLVETRLMAGARALLAADLDGLSALYDQRRIIALRQAIEYRAAAGGQTGGEMLLLQDRQGGTLAGTRTGWPGGLPVLGDGFSTDAAQVFTEGSNRWLGVARTLPGGFPLLVARSLAPMDQTLATLRRAIAAITFGMLAAGAGVGWWAAWGVMGRIGRVNALADRVAAGDLAARLPGPPTPDEFGLLETHVHAMLDRIEALNRATHRLSDSIAHELRTPLTRLSQKLARMDGTDALRADLQDAVRVFDALLDISRAEADQGHGGGLIPVDLSALTAEVADLYTPAAEDKGLRLVTALTPGVTVLGDRTLVGQAIANLIDNAVKYCTPGDTISLSLTPARVLSIADTGPGLPAAIRTEAFERFVRGAPHAGVKGHGLGLTLVRAIATRHGAKLVVPDTARGFAVELHWPNP